MQGLLTIDDFEQEARGSLTKLAYDYFRSGADAERTLQRNRAAFDDYEIWPRILRDVSRLDLSLELLGLQLPMPILIAPTAYQRLAHPEGELAMAQGAANGKFYATQKTTYDQKSIVELLGPRVPECKDAQKEFRVLIAVLTPAPALKPEDASVIDAMLVRQSTAGDDGRYTFNFYEATGGRGRMSFDLSKSKR